MFNMVTLSLPSIRTRIIAAFLQLMFLSGIAPTIAATAETSDNGRSVASVSSTLNFQELLDQGEPSYRAGNYREALPFYVKAADTVTATDGPAARIKCLRYLADDYCRLKQPDEALTQYNQIDKLISPGDVDNTIANINDKAQCYGIKADFTKGEALSHAAAKLCIEHGSELLWQLARTEAQLAYFNYLQEKYAAAISGFQTADQTVEKSGRSDITALVFRQKMAFAQAGSYYHLRRFEDAYKLMKKVYDYDVTLFGKTDLQTGWAMLALSDVLAKINH